MFCSMKITQEVREFAAKQNSESYLAPPAPVEGVEQGMKRMSELYREKGERLYVSAGDD